jgi:small neutral amino acid transporter SnatA (MarC family)
MVRGPRRADDDGMDILLMTGLFTAASAAGAVAAGLRAASPGTTSGRRAVLWTASAVLTAVALLIAVAGYWLWRFTVEFTF